MANINKIDTKKEQVESKLKNQRMKRKNESFEKAIKLTTEKMIREDKMTEEEMKELVFMFPSYKFDYPYEVGEIFEYEGELLEVIKDHTSQSDWIPSKETSIYKNHTPSNVIAEWVQPEGSHDAYEINSQVLFEGQVYISIVDNNVWSPIEYGWELK